MTPHDISLLLSVLGCIYLATAWIGRRTTGSLLLACDGGLLLAASAGS